MEFSLSLDWCGNSSSMSCELDLYIHLSNDCGCGHFYLLTRMVWCRLSSWWYCILSIVLGSAVSKGFCWPGVACIWLPQLRPDPKTFQRRHPLYWLGVLQSIVRQCISRKCSFHMVRVAGIGWWRILMTMVHTSLVYVECFRNSSRWQKGKHSWYSVFVNLTLSHQFLSSASGSFILCAPCNLHLSKCFFSTSLLVQPCKQYWQKQCLPLWLLY